MGIVKKTGYLSWIAAMLIIAACSVQEHYHTLSFFFDGVPNPFEESHTIAIDSAITFSDTTTIEKSKKPMLFVHLPYREKKCASCHNQGRMGSLNEPEPGLCYRCHSNFGNKYTKEHGPAAGGFCTECHNPHRSKEENLLHHIGDDLCMRCHDALAVSESVFHSISEETSCMSCHNPHGTDNHSLLHPGTCYRCHDNFIEKYNVLHGPVAISQCSVCHTSHSEGSEQLLVLAGNTLCLACHDAGRLLIDETHSYIEDTNCTECHNPHGGEDQFMYN